MTSATAALAVPSSVSCPGEFELMVSSEVTVGRAQPGDTTYHSGSPLASRSFGKPSVRQGSRPIAGSVQLPAAIPSFAVPM